jgi:membrane protein DedA with SNARE-associated domain
MSALIGSLIRKGLVFVGGWVVAKGWMTGDESGQVIEIVIGAIVALIPVAWSMLNRWLEARRAKKAA